MDHPDDQNLKPEETASDTRGESSTLELSNVKRILAVKMEKLDAHYTSITPLGKGSFGEVHSARDTLLGRDVAIKSLKNQYRDEEEIVDRFLKEARGTAQLEHPNIMPVHELGVNDELGVYFTMKKIEGENLKEILARLEASTSLYLKRYPLSRLLEIFLSVCNGVAFAHSKGVIHRDLKPANIMIGEYGEVLILDWGLVKLLKSDDGSDSGVQLRLEEFDEGTSTLDGAISGTPNYMSPEQAEGNVEDVDFQSDIYSLGAILYHILTHHSPFEKTQLRKLLERVKAGKFTRPRERRPDLRIPRELDAICMKAMARFQVNRYRSVEKLAEDIRNYLAHKDVSAYKAPRFIRFRNFCRRNPVKASVTAAVAVALGLMWMIQFSILYGEYHGDLRDGRYHRDRGIELVEQAKGRMASLQALRDAEMQKKKSPEELRQGDELELMVADINRHFNLAIGYFERIPEPFRKRKGPIELYTDVIWEQIEFSLYREDYATARQWLDTALVRHADMSSPLSHEARAYTNEVHRRIEGHGSLKINAAENLDEVVIWPYVEDGSRLVQGDPIRRGKSFPLEMETIRKGSYLVWITMTNGQFLPYPIHIHHGEDLELTPVIPDEIPSNLAYVPAGTFIFGGPLSRFYRQHELYVDAFFISRTEVTIGEYLEFWTSLESEQDRKHYMSRIRYHRSERQYEDAWNADGTLSDERLHEDFPVVGITHEAAEAFCRWKSEKLGRTVRLPSVQEWEKAARGVDGRTYVWGNGFDAAENLTLTKYNLAGKEKYPYWAPPGQFKRDVSVYNAYDMAGNVREMTSTLLPESTELYQLKGGSAATPENFLPCSNSSDTPVVPSDVGFRYVVELTK
ncbi:SUMF1/EgtB/PvdO family nonheme iron enzyme [Pontiella sp.]|uniref:protein kinase domain-containing protein n=1 Tax=Pontiella sp. TaxID=2837462 RepID=UPI0035682647